MKSVVCLSQITAGMQVRLCMHDACPKPNRIIWKWKMEYNSDLYNTAQRTAFWMFTGVHCRYGCAAIVDTGIVY